MRLNLLYSHEAEATSGHSCNFHIKKASARALNAVIAKCLYNRGAYVKVLSSWSLAQSESST